MTKSKLIFILIFLIYLFFIILIIISFNAVNQDEKLIIIEENQQLIKKVENSFTRNENSVYEILENKANKNSLKKDENKSRDENLSGGDVKITVGDYYLQFASFKDKKKSDKILKELTEKFKKLSINVKLEIKKVTISENQIFFRVISERRLNYPSAVNLNKSFKNLKINSIVVKSQP